MRMTLLEMVQDIANDMDSDNVNSIDDTEESMQIAQIIKTTYFKYASSRDDWQWLNARTSFDNLADVTRPTYMIIPEEMNKVHWVRYNRKVVTYLSPEDFQTVLDTRTELTGVVDANGYVLNADPQYWTTFDDQLAVFDGYDSATDTTLQSSKCVVYGNMAPSWTHDDSFIPTLPDKMFPTLLADSKSTAFLVLKQQANPKEESFAKVGRSRWQAVGVKPNDAESKSNTKVNYGRK